ncbi:hypothetical protein ECG_08298 [Echinococcus granulosus]|uniref:THAP-type domain-containing protein n=1 Tax=Echinococcus granulosus TaxID=6210 RepID=A0A068X249_ECHGR|nr:hypothetical protein ECG_08298 [Echinococcus granulosus]CDS24068.1 hypothetical protein EgrG_000378000 [Echinococcus granulosus]
MGTTPSHNSKTDLRQERSRVGIADPRGDPACDGIVKPLNREKAEASSREVGRKYLFEVDLSTITNSDPCSNVSLEALDTTPLETLPVVPPPSPPTVTLTSCKNKMEGKSDFKFGKVPADWTSPCPSSTLGVFQLNSGEYIFSMLIRQFGEDERLWRQWLRRIERTMRGLEKLYKCRITVCDRPFRYRGVMTHMIRIRGVSKKNVIQCKNALPSHVKDMLITAREYY